ncbi:formin-like protein 5 [Falco rusticolus]|uniref:formin-like protein 5 n=1 Tax=Falco rusticolus TaxID=120794 RepID=UPI00188684F5|nr:formin-like protein 5 [Falco rusticolus]
MMQMNQKTSLRHPARPDAWARRRPAPTRPSPPLPSLPPPPPRAPPREGAPFPRAAPAAAARGPRRPARPRGRRPAANPPLLSGGRAGAARGPPRGRAPPPPRRGLARPRRPCGGAEGRRGRRSRGCLDGRRGPPRCCGCAGLEELGDCAVLTRMQTMLCHSRIILREKGWEKNPDTVTNKNLLLSWIYMGRLISGMLEVKDLQVVVQQKIHSWQRQQCSSGSDCHRMS